MVGTRYPIPPLPPIPEQTELIELGPIAIGVGHRVLNDAIAAEYLREVGYNPRPEDGERGLRQPGNGGRWRLDPRLRAPRRRVGRVLPLRLLRGRAPLPLRVSRREGAAPSLPRSACSTVIPRSGHSSDCARACRRSCARSARPTCARRVDPAQPRGSLPRYGVARAEARDRPRASRAAERAVQPRQRTAQGRR